MNNKSLAILAVSGMLQAGPLRADAPAEVAHFVAAVGGSRMVTAMQHCGKEITRAYGHDVVLYDNGTFVEEIDTTGDNVADYRVDGTWEEPDEGRIMMAYTGSMTAGAIDLQAWGDYFQSVEATLRAECGDSSVDILYSTVRVEKQEIKLNRNRTEAVIQTRIKAYARGGYVRPGWVRHTIEAHGTFTED